MFQPRDHRRLGFEAADELGAVGQFRPDRLDRDLATERRLHAAKHVGEGPAPDAFVSFVVTDTTNRVGQLVAAGDPAVQFDEFVTRADTDLLDQLVTKRPERSECLHMPTAGGERLHVELSRSLTEGELADQRLELSDRLAGSSELQQ